jgi:DNA-binding CsgD family transcriptional regulator
MYAPGPHLTPRLKQVVELLKAGVSRGDMIERLGVSKHTVDTYLLVLKEKYQVETGRKLLVAVLTRELPCRDKRRK